MRYSLNQVEHTVRKAVRGAGLSWGVAEDAGRAARWLQTVSIPGAALVVSALEQLDHDDSLNQKVRQVSADAIDPDAAAGSTCLGPVSELLSPLVVGPCIGDWVNAVDFSAEFTEPGDSVILVEHVVHPLLLAGYCGVAAQQTRIGLTIEWPDFRMRCSANEARWLGPQITSNLESRAKIYPSGAAAKTPCENASVVPVHIGATEVDDQTWSKLEMLTHRTYVEATESSRLSGAGAGLNDND